MTRSLLYRRFVPGAGLSVERHTESVPYDHSFHLRSFTSERQPVESLHKLLDEMGHFPSLSLLIAGGANIGTNVLYRKSIHHFLCDGMKNVKQSDRNI